MHLLPWLLALGSAVMACSPSDVWSVSPPECGHVDGASFVEGFAVRDGSTPDPLAYAEEDGLPVLHLFVSTSLPDDDGYRPARLVYRGRCYVAQARYRGNTSLRFPKRSFTVELEGTRTFDEPELAGGFMGRRKLVLTSPFNDNSYLRARLAFELWNRMSPDHLPVKSFSAVVYVNGRYQGLYTVMDHVDRDFFARLGLDAGGDLFKAVNGDANFSRLDAIGRPKERLSEGYEKKSGEPEDGDGAFRTLDALTAFVADATPEQFLSERGAWLESRDYEDWWILSQLTYMNDSVTKNAYHFRARGPGARFRYIPWDLDATFGQDWNTVRLTPEALDSFTQRNLLFARMLEDPALSGPLRERLRTLLQGPLHRDVVQGLIDEYARELGPAALKDEARWGETYRNYPSWSVRKDKNDFEGEVRYVREWVDARWKAVEESLR